MDKIQSYYVGYNDATYLDTCCDYIKVDDLINWLDYHVRNRTISTVYSDLLEALTKQDDNQ